MSLQHDEELQSLEESLWRAETRFDRVHMERLLAPDFFEFGRSGRRYTRAETLSAVPCTIRAKIPLEDFSIRLIHPDVALVTYISEVQYALLERANRASIWVRHSDRWQLQFHQGTPI